jgi:hypothetical protein
MTCGREIRNVNRILVGKPKAERPIERQALVKALMNSRSCEMWGKFWLADLLCTSQGLIHAIAKTVVVFKNL